MPQRYSKDFDRVRPIPYKEVRPISALFCGGKSTPARRAIFLSLPLFVFRVHADDPHHAFAMDHLALVANLFDRRSHFHRFTFFVILPRPGSCGLNSTSTRSPGTSRTKFRFTTP